MTARKEDAELARLMGRILARVSHDLNNIATIWGGHLSLVREGSEDPEEAWAAFDEALAHLLRLSESLNGLGLVGSEAVTAVDIHDLVREVAASGHGSTPPELDLDSRGAVVTGRRTELARAIEALLANAREASPPGSPIRVRTRLQAGEGRVAVEVEDAGPGFAAEVRQRNFDPLVSTRGQRGRGTGVALARLVALLHGGSLRLEDRPGGGARVELSLPAG